MALFTDIPMSDTARRLPLHEGNIELAIHCCGTMMELIRDDQWIIPKPEEPVMCIEYRHKLCWAPLVSLSGAFLDRYKKYISDLISAKLPPPPEENINDASFSFMRKMYEELTIEQRKAMTNSADFNQTKLSNHICRSCYEYSDQLNKCIHFDCGGCCDECNNVPLLIPKESGGGDHVTTMIIACRACERPQVIKCPICHDDKTHDELCIIGCHHPFCWKCYGMAVIKGNQITKCPLCRCEIVEIIEN